MAKIKLTQKYLFVGYFDERRYFCLSCGLPRDYQAIFFQLFLQCSQMNVFVHKAVAFFPEAIESCKKHTNITADVILPQTTKKGDS